MQSSNIYSETSLVGERVLRFADLCSLLGTRKTATYNIIKYDGFPKSVQITPSVRGWLKSEVIAWLKTRRSDVANAGDRQ